MINDLLIRQLTTDDIESAYQVFETAIPDAFEKEGLGFLYKDLYRQIIVDKRRLVDASLDHHDWDGLFLVAKLRETVIGIISFGICGDDIKKCTDSHFHSIGELGSLYVLPCYQNQGVGSALIKAIVMHLSDQGIDQFCLDSGYKRAQKKWLRKFGAPYKVIKDYWPVSDQMIWLCKVSDFIE